MALFPSAAEVVENHEKSRAISNLTTLVVEVDWTSDVTPPRLGVVLLLLFFLSLSRKKSIK